MSSTRERVSSAAIGLCLALGACMTGCGLVVGAGDYVVGSEHDGGGTVLPEADTDVQQPMPPPDAGGPGPDATSQPDTSTPPPDSGTDSGTDSGPTMDDGGPTMGCAPDAAGLPIADAGFQQLVKACVLAVTCDPQYFPVTVSECITTDYLDTHFATKCLAGITSCNDYYACQGIRITTLSECSAASSSGTDIGSCNGAVATTCSYDGSGYVSNCGALGGTCTVYHESDYASSGDTGAGCEILSSCSDPTDGSKHCSGSNAYMCVATDTTTSVGILTASCATGSTCTTDSNEEAACLATTTACSAAGTSCSGDNLTTCESTPSGLHQYANACSAAGLTCTPSSGGTPASCTSPGCATSGCMESCLDSTHLQACIGGAPYIVDCTSLGFSFCDTANSFNSTAYNFCSNQ